MVFEKRRSYRKNPARLMERLDPLRGDARSRFSRHERENIIDEVLDIEQHTLEKKRVQPAEFIGRRVVRFQSGDFRDALFQGSTHYTKELVEKDIDEVRNIKGGRGGRIIDRARPHSTQDRMAHVIETVLTLGAAQIFGPNCEFIRPSTVDDWRNGIDLLLVIKDDAGNPVQIIALDFTSAKSPKNQDRKLTRTLRGIARDTLSTASYVTLELKDGRKMYFTARGVPRLTFALTPGAALQIAARAADQQYLALEYSSDCANAVGSMFVQLQAQLAVAERHQKHNATRHLRNAFDALQRYVKRPLLRPGAEGALIQSINALAEPEHMERIYQQASHKVSELKGQDERGNEN